MTGLQHPLVQDYLARLDRAGSGLPPEIRVELIADLSEHLDSSLTPASTDADVRNALQELGSPEDVVGAAYDGLGSTSAGGPAPAPPAYGGGMTSPAPPAYGAPTTAPVPPPGSQWPMPPPSPWGPVEIIAVLGLTIGMFVVPVIGPIVGLVMAWISDRWTKREKVVATVLCVLPVITILVAGIGLVGISSSSSSSGGVAPEPSYSSAPVPGDTP